MIKLDFFSTYVDTGEQKWNKNGTNMAQGARMEQEWNKHGLGWSLDWNKNGTRMKKAG